MAKLLRKVQSPNYQVIQPVQLLSATARTLKMGAYPHKISKGVASSDSRKIFVRETKIFDGNAQNL